MELKIDLVNSRLVDSKWFEQLNGLTTLELFLAAG